MPSFGTDNDDFAQMEAVPRVAMLLGELRTGISAYFRTAEEILSSTGIRLKMPGKEAYSFQRNFFSFLFMYSFYRAGIPASRRPFYAAVLQCLRGMVTGCDNILDDEYKKTLDTTIPATAFRFRSVMDIMVSDRVLFRLLAETGRREGFPVETVLAASAASMKTMTESGLQEASEEGGITQILEPDAILETVHHYKTGLLFTCPWDVPRILEPLDDNRLDPLLKGLYHIGMGCQVMDDVVDFALDMGQKRHNYLVSLIFHGSHAAESGRLREMLALDCREGFGANAAAGFPKGLSTASGVARRFLEKGFSHLFSPEHRCLAIPAVRFLEQRIGAAPLFERQDHGA